jgi:pSer/pThr/pTyr-binding forkhead associated (FHA) protein
MNEQALELFRRACGLNAPLALECEGPNQSGSRSASREFDVPFLLIGRDPRSDLVLDSAQVSRRHAILQVAAGRVFVFDLQSRSKVHWEGEQSPRSEGWLDEAEFIKIGPYRIRKHDPPASAVAAGSPTTSGSPRTTEQADPDLFPRASLESPIRMGNTPTLWPIDGLISIAGRSELCKLFLTDDSASRFHACLVRTPLGVWVIDLLAREGTHVNGERVRWAWLDEGDKLRIGSFTFVVRYENPRLGICRQDCPLESGAAAPVPPGTELAVPARHADNERGTLAVRSRAPSQSVLKAMSPSPTFEAASLPMVSSKEPWELTVPAPPNVMGMWQQQMQLMETFHNDMIMMVQMFFTMHREHLASAREELARVDQLTRELRSLQATLATRPKSLDPGVRAASDGTTGDSRAREHAQRPKRVKEALADEGSRARRQHEPKSAKPAGVYSEAAHSFVGHESATSRALEGTSGMDDAQLHAHLTKRITELQRERQGYWEKIMSKMNK